MRRRTIPRQGAASTRIDRPRLVSNARRFFIDKIKQHGSDPYGLAPHVHEMERWADLVLRHQDADRTVVMLAVWLHDVGHYPSRPGSDHAVRGVRIARRYLDNTQLDDKRRENVLHCIRTHRCKDEMPATDEARIVACIDSASHMTDTIYLDIARSGRFDHALAKLERDYRDCAHIRRVRRKVTPLYRSWKTLLNAYRKAASV